jgi:hypothetical protein
MESGLTNPWFRMYAEFATDPKVQMLSETDQRRYIMLLCMRCGNDDVTLQDSEVAFQLRISAEDWAKSKAIFVAKNLIGEDNKPTKWDKRQFRSDSSAERVAAHRAKKKEGMKQQGNVTSKKSNVLDTDTDTDTDTEKKSVAPAAPSPTAKGSRLPKDFEPDFRFAMEQGIANTLEEASKFRDYWNSQPGQKGVKTDWQATWRNWCRNAKGKSPAQPVNKQAALEQRNRAIAEAWANGDGVH